MPSAATNSSVDWTLRRAAITDIGGALVSEPAVVEGNVVGGGVKILTGVVGLDFLAKR